MTFDFNKAADEALQNNKKQGFDAKKAADDMLSTDATRAREILGADFDPKNTASIGLRISIARGDNLEEKTNKLKKRFPEGELKTMPQSVVLGFEDDVLLWRETPQAQWKLVDPVGFDIGDIPEAIAPSLESIVAETAMAIRSRGMSVPATVGRQIVGAMVGESSEQALQYVTGDQAQSIGGIAKEIGAEGMYSGIGGFAMSPLVAAGNIATGRGALRVGEEGLETINAAKRLHPELYKKLTPALVTDNPAIVLSEKQSAVLLPGLQRRYRELASILNNAVEGKIDKGALRSAISRVTDGLQRLKNDFMRKVGSPSSPMSKGGEALQSGVEEYSRESRKAVSALYDAARSIEEPNFDMVPLYDVGSDLIKGMRGSIDPRVGRLVADVRSINGPIALSDGSLLSVTDQLRNIRTELYALKHVKPGEVADQTTAQASKLYDAITTTLKSPDNATPAFKSAWKAANDAAADRLTTLEKAPIIAITKSQNAAQLVVDYAKPGQVGNLLTIRETISPRRWDQFVNSFYSDLLSDPSATLKRLSAFDTETLDVMMPKADQEVWKKIALDLQRLDSVGADKIAERQISNKNFIDSLVNATDPRSAQTIIRAANNTNDAAMRDSVRAGIIEWTWDGIVVPGKNTLKVNEPTLKARVASLKRSGLWRMLSTSDKEILSDAAIVAKAFGQIADAGTSIQAAEAVSNIKKLQASAIMTFVRNEMVAQFYMSSMGRKMLIGGGLPNSNGEIIRLLGGALTQVSVPEDISTLK